MTRRAGSPSMRSVPERLSTPHRNEKMLSTRLPGRALLSAARAAIGVALAAAAIHAAPAGADTVTSKYTTPGTYTLTIPDHATSVNVIANGASGNDGANSLPFSAGGAGGLGAAVNANLAVAQGLYIAPGDTLQIDVGRKGSGGTGGRQSSTGGRGGNGGGAAVI